MNRNLLVMILLAMIIVSFPVYVFVLNKYRILRAWIAARCTIRYGEKLIKILNDFLVKEICTTILAMEESLNDFPILTQLTGNFNAQNIVDMIVNDSVDLIIYQGSKEKLFYSIAGPAKTIEEYIDLPIHKLLYYYFKGSRRDELISYVFMIVVSVIMNNMSRIIDVKEVSNGTHYYNAKGDLPQKEGVNA